MYIAKTFYMSTMQSQSFIYVSSHCYSQMIFYIITDFLQSIHIFFKDIISMISELRMLSFMLQPLAKALNEQLDEDVLPPLLKEMMVQTRRSRLSRSRFARGQIYFEIWVKCWNLKAPPDEPLQSSTHLYLLETRRKTSTVL